MYLRGGFNWNYRQIIISREKCMHYGQEVSSDKNQKFYMLPSFICKWIRVPISFSWLDLLQLYTRFWDQILLSYQTRALTSGSGHTHTHNQTVCLLWNNRLWVTKITQNHQASYMRSNFSPHLLRDNHQVQKSHLQIHLHHQLLNNLLHHHLFHNQIGFPQVPPVQWKWHLDVTDEIV